MDARDRDLVALYFRSKNPNRDRVGCPELSILQQIASGSLELESPWYDHLTVCAPCFSKTEGLKTSIESGRRRRGRLAAVATALAAGLLIAGLIWWRPAPTTAIEQPQSVPSIPPLVQAGPPPEHAEAKRKETVTIAALAIVDLGASAVTRGTESFGTTAPRIRPIPQRLNLLLPMASEIGNYNIRLLDRNLKSTRETTGKAALKDGRTVLSITLDATVSPGLYQLALQHESEDWRLYPLEIKN